METLSPTYRLLIGVPGRSNAFEISKRLGLSEDVINSARTLIHSETNKVDNMIASLEESTRLAEKEEQEAKDYLKSAEKIHKDLQKEMMEFYKRKDELYEKARNEAKQIVKNAEREAEEVIKSLRQMQFEKSAEIKEHELIEARKRLEEAVPHARESKIKQPKKPAQNFQAGDEVKVTSFDQKGHLIEKVSEHEWVVQMGILKMKVEDKDLELIKSKPVKETKPMIAVKGKEYHVGLELDLRGERYENALLRVEKYIDDALLAGYPRVSIIHGKGTGALRTGVQNYLKNNRQVKSYHYGSANEGGTGVTVVEFK